jgi:hypothetical protein
VEREVLTNCEQVDFALGYFLPRERDWVKEVEVAGRSFPATEYGYLRQAHRVTVSRPLKQRCACVVTAREP